MAKRVWLKGQTFIIIFMIRIKTMVILRDYPIEEKKVIDLIYNFI
jgi:hypothetical protein